MKRIISVLRNSGMPVLLFLLIMTVILMLTFSSKDRNGHMTQLESRISETLSRTEGAGEVRVVIRTVRQAQQNKTITGYSVMDEVPCGAVAVVQGGSDPLVRMKLTNALCALLGLHASQVEVVDINEGNVD